MQAGQVASLENWCFVVVGDRKSPERFEIPPDEEWSTPEALRAKEEGRLVYLSAEAQRKLPYAIMSHLEWNHFGRKNIGYVYAIHHGAELIYDTDDDNFLQTGDIPLGSLMRGMSLSSSDVKRTWPKVELSAGTKVYNPYYRSFRSEHEGKEVFTWPRGFPLDYIQDTNTFTNRAKSRCGAARKDKASCGPHKVTVVQSLADNDPDVDAVYRLTRELPVKFAKVGYTEWIPTGVFSPFNSQAVIFSKPAFWGLLLPVSVHGRVSDIWRSYITQRLMWDLGQSLAFAAPWVTQCRNPHSYLGDLDSELHLYARAGEFLHLLERWALKESTLEGRIEELVIALYEWGIIEESDVKLSLAWIEDLLAIGYEFPLLERTFKAQEPAKPSTHVTDDSCEREVWLNSQVKSLTTFSKPSPTLSNPKMAAKLAVGILSHSANVALRDATRRTWMSHVPPDVQVFFLLDRNSSEVHKESIKNGDIIVINSKYTGRANHFGEKLYNWFKLALDLFPNAEAIAKMDDDTYLCPNELFEGVLSRITPTMYYGHMHKPNTSGRFGMIKRIDEALVVVGRELVERIASRPYCPKQSGCPRGSLVDTNFGGTSLGLWVGGYDDVNAIAANEVTLHQAPNFRDYKCGSTEVSFWNSIKSADQLKRIHAVNMPSKDSTASSVGRINASPKIILGILSAETNTALRTALRETWIPLLPDSVRVYFLLDTQTASSSAEHRAHGDVVILNSRFTGTKDHLGEKLYLWFRKALQLHPNSTAIGKLNDDSYMCPITLFQDIEKHLSRKLYYGFLHEEEKGGGIGTKRRMDEAFVLVGTDLVSRISQRRYCPWQENCPENGLLDTNYGGTSLGLWLSPYSDIKVVPSTAISLHPPSSNNIQICGAGPVAFWNKIKSAEELKRIHALNK